MTGAALAPQAADPLEHAWRTSYTCPECGHGLSVSGLGRHRVYFELGDERTDRPVMNRICPQCGHGLLGRNA